MSDFIDEYRNRVRKRLSRSESEPVVRLAEVLCFPSFHAETLLQVVERTNGTSFRLFTFSSSLWYSRDREEPGRIQETVAVTVDRANRFWESMRSLVTSSTEPGKSVGLDGMSVSVTYREGVTESHFDTWCPSPVTPQGQCVGLIYRLAWEVIQSDTSIERLEQLHGYLDLGLPARVINGDVKCLRLFGSLPSSFETELRKTFESLKGDEPLLVDLTNFDGMGTLLYPAFIAFALGRKNLAWAASPIARHHIDAMKLNEPVVFDSTVDAASWLRQNSFH